MPRPSRTLRSSFRHSSFFLGLQQNSAAASMRLVSRVLANSMATLCGLPLWSSVPIKAMARPSGM